VRHKKGCTVLARADGSMLLGMGNVTRCMAIAKELEARDHRIVWIGREHDPRVRAYVSASGCDYVGMPANLTLEEDATFFRRVAEQEGAELAVVDLANPVATKDLARYSQYLQNLASVCRLSIVDDMTRAVFPRAVVINPNTGVSASAYDCSLSPAFLFGPEHAILRASYRGASANKVYSTGKPRHVVVALGGGDTARGILPGILRGIREGLGASIGVRLVIGLDDGESLRRGDALLGFDEPVTILQNVPSLTDELTAADVAIVSGGVTKYEAAATGTPSVIVATIDHQEWWGQEFARTGAAFYAGGPEDVTPQSVEQACSALLDAGARERAGRRGAALVDGCGARRIAEAMLTLGAVPSAPAAGLKDTDERMHSND